MTVALTWTNTTVGTIFLSCNPMKRTPVAPKAIMQDRCSLRDSCCQQCMPWQASLHALEVRHRLYGLQHISIYWGP